MLSTKAKRRLGILTGLALLACLSVGGLWVVRKYQIRHQYARYRADGLAAVASGDNDRALELLLKYLGRYPSDVDVLIAYAETRQKVPLPKNGHLQQAIPPLRAALRLDPSRTEQRRELMMLYWKAGAPLESLQLADEFLKTNPIDKDALQQRALSLVAMRKADEAVAAARKWAEADPANMDAQLLLAGLLATKDKDASIKYADSLAAKKEIGDLKVQVIRGLARMNAGRLDEAKPILVAAAATKPRDKSVVLPLSDGLDRIGLDKESVALLRTAADGGEREIRQRLLRHVWQDGNLKGYVELVPTPTSDPQTQWAEETALKAVSLRRIGKSTEAAALVDQLKAKPGELEAAWVLAADLLGGSPLDAAIAGRLRDSCTAALAEDPDNPFLNMALAEAEKELGEQDLALRRYQQLAARNPSWLVPILRVSELQFARGEYVASFSAAFAAHARAPENVRVAAILARVWDVAIDTGHRTDEKELFELVERIQKAVPGEDQTLGIYVRRLSKAGRTDDAKTALAKALANNESTPEELTLLSWAQASQSLGLGLEQDCLNRSEKLHGATPQSTFFRASLMSASGQGNDGLDLVRKARQSAPQGSPDAYAWDLVEARYLDSIGSPEAAASWARLSERYPTNAAVQQALLSSASTKNDRPLQAAAIERLGKASGESTPLWRLAKARWLVAGSLSTGEAQEAALLLNETLKSSPDSVEALFLLARCLDKLNNLPQAIERLSTAARLKPESSSISLYLAQLLQKSGEYAKAKEQLDRAISSKLTDPEDRRRAAALLAQRGDSAQAVTLLRDSQGQSHEADLLLAEQYFRLNQFDRALELSEKLLRSPDLATIRFTAELYAAMGRTPEAENVLSQLDKLNESPGAKQILRAEFEAKHGSLQKSTEILRQAANESPHDAAVRRALVANLLLQSRIADALDAASGGLKSIPDDPTLLAISKRRVLIQVTADRGLLPLAIGLVQSPDDPALLDASNLLTSPDADQPAKALVNLSHLADKYPNSLPVQVVVIDRELAFDRPSQAAPLASRAIQAFPLSAEPPKLAVRAYAKLNDWQQALAMAQLSRQRTAGSALEADLVIAEIQAKLGLFDAAATTLAPYVAMAKDRPDAVAVAVARYGQALYAAGKGDQAEAILKPLIGGGGSIFQAWAQTASRTLPRAQAEAWVERIRQSSDKSIPSTITVAVAEATLSQRFDDPARRATAKQMLNELATRSDLQESQLVGIGVYLETLGDMESAERIYRRAIPKNDPEALARNNLAMILARRSELPEALTLAKSAVQTAPDRAYALDTLAFVQRKLKDYTSAAAILRGVIHREPWAIEWRLSLAEVLSEAGKTQDAKSELAAISELIPDQSTLTETTRQRLQVLQRGFEKSGPAPQASQVDSDTNRARLGLVPKVASAQLQSAP